MFFIYIPKNKYGIDEGDYTFIQRSQGDKSISDLLRENKDKPEVIIFIASMLEL